MSQAKHGLNYKIKIRSKQIISHLVFVEERVPTKKRREEKKKENKKKKKKKKKRGRRGVQRRSKVWIHVLGCKKPNPGMNSCMESRVWNPPFEVGFMV